MLGLFKKKKKDKHFYDYLTVKDLQWHGKNAATIAFEAPEEPFDYKSGQYLTVIADVEGKEERRSYSLSSSPFLDKHPAITIKREEGGKVSGYLIDHLKPGDQVKVIKPMGKFTTDYDPKNKRHLVFIGGGSGITPLYSILKSALNQEPESKVTLIYSNRDDENVIFKEELQQLAVKHNDRFTYYQTFSRPGDSWAGEKGRLDQKKLASVLGDELKANEYYLCGPQGLMKTAEEYLKEKGCVNVFKESFVASDEIKNIKVVEAEGQRKASEVTVIDGGEEYVFTVEPDKTILETALDNGIDLPYSCQSGICTTCRCKKLDGEVEMETSEGLTDGEIEEGYVLICVGHAKSDKVKLDLE